MKVPLGEKGRQDSGWQVENLMRRRGKVVPRAQNGSREKIQVPRISRMTTGNLSVSWETSSLQIFKYSWAIYWLNASCCFIANEIHVFNGLKDPSLNSSILFRSWETSPLGTRVCSGWSPVTYPSGDHCLQLTLAGRVWKYLRAGKWRGSEAKRKMGLHELEWFRLRS